MPTSNIYIYIYTVHYCSVRLKILSILLVGIKLIKSDIKDILCYKRFLFQINAVLLNFPIFKEFL